MEIQKKWSSEPTILPVFGWKIVSFLFSISIPPFIFGHKKSSTHRQKRLSCVDFSIVFPDKSLICREKMIFYPAAYPYPFFIELPDSHSSLFSSAGTAGIRKGERCGEGRTAKSSGTILF